MGRAEKRTLATLATMKRLSSWMQHFHTEHQKQFSELEIVHVSEFMAILKYFKKTENNNRLQTELQANEHLTVNKKINPEIENREKHRGRPVSYATYSDEDRADIRRYAIEHGPTAACKHFSKISDLVCQKYLQGASKERLHELIEHIKG